MFGEQAGGVRRSDGAGSRARLVIAPPEADVTLSLEGDSAVTPWPQEVTVSMLLNMAAGGAAINVPSARAGADVMITDVGVKLDYPVSDRVRDRKVAPGTRDLPVEPAMTRDQSLAAIEVGLDGVIASAGRPLVGRDPLRYGDLRRRGHRGLTPRTTTAGRPRKGAARRLLSGAGQASTRFRRSWSSSTADSGTIVPGG